MHLRDKGQLRQGTIKTLYKLKVAVFAIKRE
jgi:hypothetical protein